MADSANTAAIIADDSYIFRWWIAFPVIDFQILKTTLAFSKADVDIF